MVISIISLAQKMHLTGSKVDQILPTPCSDLRNMKQMAPRAIQLDAALNFLLFVWLGHLDKVNWYGDYFKGGSF